MVQFELLLCLLNIKYRKSKWYIKFNSLNGAKIQFSSFWPTMAKFRWKFLLFEDYTIFLTISYIMNGLIMQFFEFFTPGSIKPDWTPGTCFSSKQNKPLINLNITGFWESVINLTVLCELYLWRGIFNWWLVFKFWLRSDNV